MGQKRGNQRGPDLRERPEFWATEDGRLGGGGVAVALEAPFPSPCGEVRDHSCLCKFRLVRSGDRNVGAGDFWRVFKSHKTG